MAEFIIHTIPGSPFARAALATLEEKQTPYRVVSIPAAELKERPYLDLHPFGRMPVLDHGGFVLYETQAILRYIDRILPEPSLTPSNPKAAARMDQVMNVNDWYLFHGVADVIAFQRIVGPKLMGLQTDEGAISAAMPKGRVVIGELSRLLGQQPYFAGDRLSLADLAVAPQLDFIAMTPEWSALSRDAPNLVEWLDRMRKRQSLQATTWDRVSEMVRDN